LHVGKEVVWSASARREGDATIGHIVNGEVEEVLVFGGNVVGSHF